MPLNTTASLRKRAIRLTARWKIGCKNAGVCTSCRLFITTWFLIPIRQSGKAKTNDILYKKRRWFSIAFFSGFHRHNIIRGKKFGKICLISHILKMNQLAHRYKCIALGRKLF